MANNFSAFFETLVAGADEYNKAKVGRTALLDAVYKDVKPEAARVGKTVDVYFPDVGPMTAVNNNVITPSSVASNYVPLVFQSRVGKGLQFQDFEQWQTAVDLAQKFFDPLYKRAKEYLNGQIAALITPANFNSNAAVIGAVQGEVTVTDQLAAWDALADQKVPLEDTEKLRLMVHNNIYRKMIGDSAWVQESLVGVMIAQEARTTGKLAGAFNFLPTWDQQMPSTSGQIIYGQVSVTNGSATVTGLSTSFTTDLTTANKVVFGNDTNKIAYAISSITSDTSLTLTTTYAGATATTTARSIQVLTGTVSASTTAMTGVGTAFTTQLVPGQWIQNLATPNGGYSQIASITSDTAAVLVAAPTVALSGATVLVKGYNSLALHEYAIALALRPIATPDVARDVVDVTYIDLQGIPLRVMVSYVHIYQALYVTIDYGYALGVIRPDFGVLIQS